MPVFDFNNAPEEKKEVVCTYTTFSSNEKTTSAEKPILVLDNKKRQWKHHSSGKFTNPTKATTFEFEEEDGTVTADILKIDSRFVSLLKWLGENHINVRLSGENTENGYAVYKIRETAAGGVTKLSAEDGFLQFMIERLLASNPPIEEELDEDQEEEGDSMKLTSIQSITDFMNCAGRTLPDNIRLWARRNLAVARSNEVSQEERHHAQRALSIMMNIQWKNNYFEAIDPVEARKILDEELYGMERVKQRIMETIIQINRTHTLPAYGLLLIGPAGTGKSQIAYAVARILKLPWTTLDMSSINDPEQLTGSSRIYSNAKPGIIMDAFSMAGESNLVFIINELDKAASGKGNGNPADVFVPCNHYTGMVSRQAGACGRRASVCNPCGYAANPAAETEGSDSTRHHLHLQKNPTGCCCVARLWDELDRYSSKRQAIPSYHLGHHLHLIADLLPLVQNDEGAYQNRNARGRWLFNLWRLRHRGDRARH